MTLIMSGGSSKKHNNSFPTPRDPIDYRSHHGAPTAYFEEGLVPLLSLLGIDLPYSYGLAPTIEMPKFLHNRTTTLWNNILRATNKLLGRGKVGKLAS